MKIQVRIKRSHSLKKYPNNQKRNETGSRVFFYPRIIREFDDGPDEKPMIYGDRYE